MRVSFNGRTRHFQCLDEGSTPFIRSSGNVQQSTSFKKAFQARGHRFESCPPCNFFYNNMAVAQLARALKINNKRFLKISCTYYLLDYLHVKKDSQKRFEAQRNVSSP